MECCYGSQPILRYGSYSISSQCGVQQGDPLGPLGFALALHPIIERIQAEVPGLLANAWYLDDGTLCGSPDNLAKAFDIVEEDGPALLLNHHKSHLFVPHNSVPLRHLLPSDIPFSSEGFCLLGSPIGSVSFMEEAIQDRVDKVGLIINRLPDLEDAQMATSLLRSCLAFPKINFSLRTCPPTAVRMARRL